MLYQLRQNYAQQLLGPSWMIQRGDLSPNLAQKMRDSRADIPLRLLIISHTPGAIMID
jgi:hypothetical protein